MPCTPLQLRQAHDALRAAAAEASSKQDMSARRISQLQGKLSAADARHKRQEAEAEALRK